MNSKNLLVGLFTLICGLSSARGEPVFNLTNPPTITSTIATFRPDYGYSIMSAQYNVNITAINEDVNISLPSDTSAFTFSVYRNGIVDDVTNYPSSITYSQPTGTTLSRDGDSFTIVQNTSVTIPVVFTWTLRDLVGNSNALASQLTSISWSTGNGPLIVDISMKNNPVWRTPYISGIAGESQAAIPEIRSYSLLIGMIVLSFVMIALWLRGREVITE